MTTEPTAKVQELPSWEDCEAAVDEGRATPLEEFIYDHEPADTHDPEWRQDLQAALSSRDQEIREVLEGLSRVLYYTHGQPERCWCPDPNSNWTHTPACLAARGLWERVQPTKENL